jgi:DNA-binding CsgD family transcriptional regulator
MDGMPRYGRVGLGLGAVTMFSVMIAFEILQEPDLTIADVVSEVLMTALLVGTTVTSALLLSRMRVQEERSADLQRGLDGVHALNAQWRTEMAEHVRELGSAIQRQFAAWGLTPSEQEVGLLLLKGFSHKEIARFRRTSEVTIRQQATCVYQKSGLSGRAGLSAYFLEELLLPETAAQPSTAAE